MLAPLVLASVAFGVLPWLLLLPWLPTVVADPDGEVAAIYKTVARRVAVKIAEKAKDFSAKFPTIQVSASLPGASPETSRHDNDFIKTATLSINIYDKPIQPMIAPNIRCYIY